MIDPESWIRVHQQDREREIHAAHRSSLLRASASGAPQRSPTPRLRPLGRPVGRPLVRVGLRLMLAD
jgi:hypothetical protein